MKLGGIQRSALSLWFDMQLLSGPRASVYGLFDGAPEGGRVERVSLRFSARGLRKTRHVRLLGLRGCTKAR